MFLDKGISPNEFKRTQMRDIKDVLEISDAINSKIKSEREVQDLMNQMKHG